MGAFFYFESYREYWA